MLIYKRLRGVLMVDNVVNWYMESTPSHLFHLVRAVLYQQHTSQPGMLKKNNGEIPRSTVDPDLSTSPSEVSISPSPFFVKGL